MNIFHPCYGIFDLLARYKKMWGTGKLRQSPCSQEVYNLVQEMSHVQKQP